MDVLILTAGAGFVLLAIGFGLVFARLISRDRIMAPLDDWEAVLSPSRYRAIERLLEEADQEVVASKGDAKKETMLRRVRIKIFRGYMQQLSEDFNRICKSVKLELVNSQVDRPELTGFVMKQQLLFSFRMMAVESKLLVYEFGWSGADTTPLTRSLETMRIQLQSLAAIAEPAAA